METTQEIQDILTAHRDNRKAITEFALRCANRAQQYADEAGTVIAHYLADMALRECGNTIRASDPDEAIQEAVSAAVHTIECATRGDDVETCDGARGERCLQSDDLADLFGPAAHAMYHESQDGETPHA